MQKGAQTTAYTYDGMGRLLTETEGNTATVYTYTQSGNRATKTVTADGVTTQTATYAYDKNNRLTKEQSTQDGQTVVTGYTYDHNGNQIIKNAMVLSSEGGARSFALGENNNSTELFTYDLRNRLTQYKTGDTKASYTYGADGFRNSKTVNGVLTSFIYDGANIVETKQGETVTDYIRGVGLIKYTDGTTTAYYFTDDHGSTSSLYGANGTKLADYAYDAFGNEEQVSLTDTNPFRYCGEYTDQESGLVYLRARYYDPQTGRFMSEDTHWNVQNMIYGDKEYEEGETKLLDIAAIMQSGNLYVYCMNNPIVFVDSTGEVGESVFDAISFALSLKDVIDNPEDIWAWAALVGDAIDFIPFLTGVGETVKVVGVANKAANTVDTASDVAKITTKEATDIAKKLGFEKTKYYSHGQAVYKKGNRYITIDADKHSGGFWKMADSVENLGKKETRLGTYDVNLNRIGD